MYVRVFGAIDCIPKFNQITAYNWRGKYKCDEKKKERGKLEDIFDLGGVGPTKQKLKKIFKKKNKTLSTSNSLSKKNCDTGHLTLDT